MLSSNELVELWEAEKEAWSVLLDGQGVTEHLEDRGYYEAIRTAMDRHLQTQCKGD